MTQKPTFDYDIIVIGSGAGGAPAASILARAGKRVAIIERGAFGGESPNHGDMPLGALLHAAHTYRDAKTAATFGLRTASTGYNYPSLMAWRDTVIKRTGAGGNRSYYEKQGISVFAGNAHFLSPNELSVGRRRLSARKFLIATGSSWAAPAIPGLSEVPYLTPATISRLTRPPKSLFIVGSGTTAMELAHLFSSLGTKVFISEQAARILPVFDGEVSDAFTQDAKARGITLLPGSQITAVQKEGLQKRISYLHGRQQRSVKIDELIIADQRLSETDLGLENAGVAYTDAGITVSTSMQTSARHIFAAGSCVDTTLQTHAILTQSRAAAHNLLHRSFIEADTAPDLHVTFTAPELAQTGLNEAACLAKGVRYTSSVAPLILTARSNITDHRTGFVKLIADSKGVIIGATIVAPHASDIITQLSLAIRYRLTAQQLITTPNCFTAWTEAIRIAAGKLL